MKPRITLVWTISAIALIALIALSKDSHFFEWVNTTVGKFFIELRHPLFNPLVEFYTWIGNTSSQAVIYAIFAAVLFASRRKKDAYAVLIAGIAIGSIVAITKYLFAVSRPDWGLPVPTSLSFPSGHSAGFACLMTIFYRCYPYSINMLIALTLALAMGLSRLYLGVHWTTDVLAGWLLGYVVGNVVALCAPVSSIPKGEKPS